MDGIEKVLLLEVAIKINMDIALFIYNDIKNVIDLCTVNIQNENKTFDTIMGLNILKTGFKEEDQEEKKAENALVALVKKGIEKSKKGKRKCILYI